MTDLKKCWLSVDNDKEKRLSDKNEELMEMKKTIEMKDQENKVGNHKRTCINIYNFIKF